MRARVFLWILFLFCAPTSPAKPLKVHIISGSKEYKSEESLKEFKEHLEEKHDIVCTASWGRDGAKSLDNLDKLKEADLLLIFARRMKLPEKQMEVIRNHWEQGKPVVGIRTAGHAFQAEDNEHFDRKVLGGHYKGHFGNQEVKVTNVKEHPVLEGVKPFTSSKLYKAGELPETTTVLQTGDIGKEKHPVTLINTYKGGRMFFTSLGVPEDFKQESFRRMLVNAIRWTSQSGLDR